jgi:hypothetical protein
MKREEVARNILLCGLSHGREHVMNRFGDDLAPLIFTTFAELHRKNALQDAFVFLLIRMFHRKYPAVDHEYELKKRLSCKEILEYMQFSSEYRKDQRRMYDITEGEMNSIIEEFVQILARQFLCNPEVYEGIEAKLNAPDNL